MLSAFPTSLPASASPQQPGQRWHTAGPASGRHPVPHLPVTSAPTAPGNTISTRASFPICTASPDPKSPSQGLGHPRSPLLASLDRRLPIPNSNPRGLKVGKRPLAHSNGPSLATSLALFTSPPLQVWPCSQGASRKRRGEGREMVLPSRTASELHIT